MQRFSGKNSAAFIGILDQGMVSATTFLTGIILARCCLKSEYGLYYLVITLLPLWDNLRLALISMPLTVFLPREENKQCQVCIGVSLILIVILVITGIICTGIIAVLIRLFADDHALAQTLSVSSILVAAHILQRFMRGLFHARLQNHYALMISGITSILQLGGILILNSLTRLTAVNAVMLITVASLAGSAVGLTALFIGEKISFDRIAFREMWRKNRKFGRWLLWKSIVYTAVLQSPPWFLKFTNDISSVAAFAACMTIVNGVNPFWIGFTNSLGPKISHAFVQNGITGIRHTIRSGQMILIPMTVFITACICIYAEPLLRLLYGDKYTGSGLILAGLSVALLISVCTFALEQGLLTIEKTDTVFYIYLWALCLCFTPVFFMIRAYGIQGVVAGYLMICMVISILRVVFYYREIKISLSYSWVGLPVKYILDYKHRGRGYYLREMLRPFIWSSVRRGNKGKNFIRIRRNSMTWTLPAYDRTISASIFVHGHFNKTQVEQVINFAKADRHLAPLLSKDRVLLDIGANCGTASLFFAKHGVFDRIRAIEPDPENYTALKENLRLNPMASEITAHQCAISSFNGRIGFKRSVTNSGAHQVTFGQSDKDSALQVSCVTLDDFLKKNQLNPRDIGLIWIDIQGHEAHALAYSRLLKQHIVPVFTEFWPYGLMKQKGLENYIRFIRQRYSRFVELETRSGKPRETSTVHIDRLVRRIGTCGRSTDILLCP